MSKLPVPPERMLTSAPALPALLASGACIGADHFSMQASFSALHVVAVFMAPLIIGVLVLLVYRQQRKLRAANKQMEQLLGALPSGVFLLDKQLHFGTWHSAQLEKMLGTAALARRAFFEVLAGITDAQTLRAADKYLQRLLTEPSDRRFSGEANPFLPLPVAVPSDAGQLELRKLSFSFQRIHIDSAFSHFLVSVEDVTASSATAAQLAKFEQHAEQTAEQTIELLCTALSMERPALYQRFAHYEALLHEANTHLRNSGQSNSTFRDLIDQVFQPLHAINEDTTALGLKPLANGAADVEQELAALRAKPEISGHDFLSVTLKLDELYGRLRKLRQMIEKIPAPKALADTAQPQPAGAPLSVTSASAPQFGLAVLQRACQHTAEGLGKQVEVQGSNVSAESIPLALQETVSELLLLLAEHALAQSIETPAARAKLGKAQSGMIHVHFAEQDDGYELLFRDDGQGVDFELIRQRAIAFSCLSPEQAAALEPRQLAGLIFEPGFSSATSAEPETRGPGLDAVMSVVQRAQGKISVATEPGRFTQFRIRFPRLNGVG